MKRIATLAIIVMLLTFSCSTTPIKQTSETRHLIPDLYQKTAALLHNQNQNISKKPGMILNLFFSYTGIAWGMSTKAGWYEAGVVTNMRGYPGQHETCVDIYVRGKPSSADPERAYRVVEYRGEYYLEAVMDPFQCVNFKQGEQV